MAEIVVTEEDLARLLGVHAETLARQRRQVRPGEPAPPIIRIGRFTRWLATEGDLTRPYREWSEKWHQSRRQTTTSVCDGEPSPDRTAAGEGSAPARRPRSSAATSKPSTAKGETGRLGLSQHLRSSQT